MSRESFLEEIDLRRVNNSTEVIDGITVVHTGKYVHFINSKGRPVKEEKLEIYDSNGNRFYSNCSSIEKAYELVERLKEEGREAIIGKKAPIIVKESKNLENYNKDYVGVYIIEERENSKLDNEKNMDHKLELDIDFDLDL